MTTNEELLQTAEEWKGRTTADGAPDLITRLADALRSAEAADAARLRDLEHPEYTPESVVDAAFEGEAGWWVPGRSAPVQPVLVADLIERVAGNAYRATLAHLAKAPNHNEQEQR